MPGARTVHPHFDNVDKFDAVGHPQSKDIDVLALWMPNSIKSYNRSFAIVVRKYDLIMRNVLKLLSQ
jgi:hypothetical protein